MAPKFQQQTRNFTGCYSHCIGCLDSITLCASSHNDWNFMWQ